MASLMAWSMASLMALSMASCACSSCNLSRTSPWAKLVNELLLRTQFGIGLFCILVFHRESQRLSAIRFANLHLPVLLERWMQGAAVLKYSTCYCAYWLKMQLKPKLVYRSLESSCVVCKWSVVMLQKGIWGDRARIWTDFSTHAVHHQSLKEIKILNAKCRNRRNSPGARTCSRATSDVWSEGRHNMIRGWRNGRHLFCSSARSILWSSCPSSASSASSVSCRLQDLPARASAWVKKKRGMLVNMKIADQYR